MATCPPGTKLIGFGGRAATEPSRNVALHSANAVAVEDPDGYVGNWFLNAYAICA